MNGRVFIAFLIGLAVASGVTYYLTSKPEPVKTTAVQTTPAPAPSDTAQPAASTAAVQPAPAPLEQAKPSPAEPQRAPARSESAGSRKTRTATRPQHVPAAHSTISPAPAPQPASTETPKPVETASNAPAPAPAPAPAHESAPSWNLPPPPPKPNTVTVPAGTLLMVRLNEGLNSERNHEGDSFTATLDQPLVVDGFVVAERGARAQGRIVQSLRSGRVDGLAKLGVELVQITTADGQKVHVNTGAFERQADPTKKKDAAKVGVGAAIGAAIGAMAGGGKGAAIGAGVGGAAGAGDVLLTRGKPAEIPVETRVSFRLRDPVTITEQLH